MEKQFKVRSLLIGIFFFLLFFIVIGRIYWLQVVQASELREMAQEVWKEEEILKPIRGTIMDRNSRPLAEETAAYTVVVSPQDIHARGLEREVAHGLASVLKLKDDPAYLIDLEDRLYKLVTKKKPDSEELRTWVEVGNEGWKIDGEKKRTIDELVKKFQDQLKQKDRHYKVVGIYTTPTQKRSYPNGRLASQLLGYLSKDGEAMMGLEKQLNQQLTGTVGELIQETDLKGVEIPGSKMTLTPAIDGLDVRLTIDQNIQYYIEKTLRKYTAEWKPKSMTAIAVNPKTMEVLGMASTPDFDPNRFWEFEDQRAFRNRAISDQFEPGSTFKIVTLAGAIEQNLWKPEAIYNSGSVKFTGMSTIRDHNWVGWGPISFMEGLVRSSNVLFAKLGYEEIGKEQFKAYVNKFGFGEKTGIDLAGEGAGSAPFHWESDYARATFGQSISVTALQEVAAFAAIANGGKLMKPYVIKEIIEPQTGKVIQTKKPELVRQVVSPEVARQTTLALEHVMIDEHGTGLGAAINGYRIAGKTGTANIVPEGAKTYSEDTWLISFIGYAPVEDPQILIAIIADQPELAGDFHAGSSVTLPAFKEIMGETLAYMGIPTSDSKEKLTQAQATASVPDLIGLTTAAANSKLKDIGLTSQVLGDGAKVTRQLPAPGTDLSLGRGVVVVTGSVSKATIPDLTGMSLRDAVEIATLLQMDYTVKGEGFVTAQKVKTVKSRKVLELILLPISETPLESTGTPSDGEVKD